MKLRRFIRKDIMLLAEKHDHTLITNSKLILLSILRPESKICAPGVFFKDESSLVLIIGLDGGQLDLTSMLQDFSIITDALENTSRGASSFKTCT
jgi:hypothetical protein